MRPSLGYILHSLQNKLYDTHGCKVPGTFWSTTNSIALTEGLRGDSSLPSNALLDSRKRKEGRGGEVKYSGALLDTEAQKRAITW